MTDREGIEASGGRRRVLVVDDDATSRRVAESMLARHDVDVATADSGHGALDLIATQPCDLVLLDGMMPGLDGPATAREIRRRERAAGGGRIPIIALTASVLPEDQQRMLDAGMDDHIAKPLRSEELAGALERWLPAVPSGAATVIAVAARGDVRQPVALATEPDKAAGGSQIVDPAAFERLCELGDATFVERLVRLFLADATERVTQAEDAIAARDGQGLRAALHALEGICGNVGAAALDQRVREIHQAYDRGDTPGEANLRSLLEATLRRFDELLAART